VSYIAKKHKEIELGQTDSMAIAICILQYHQKHKNMGFKDGYCNTQKRMGSHSHRRKLENKLELISEWPWVTSDRCISQLAILLVTALSPIECGHNDDSVYTYIKS